MIIDNSLTHSSDERGLSGSVVLGQMLPQLGPARTGSPLVLVSLERR